MASRAHWVFRKPTLKFKPAFTSPRIGQPEAQTDIQTAVNHSNTILFEAPTGFGKTGILLEFALSQLKNNRYQRAIYLTGKSTGQLQVTRQIKKMVTQPDALRYFQIRNKREHANLCPLHGCDAFKSCTASLEQNQYSTPLTSKGIFSKGTLNLDAISLLSVNTNICTILNIGKFVHFTYFCLP